MDFEKVLAGITNYSVYCMMRENGNAADKLTHFAGHEELEKQYQSGLTPDQLGKDIIDAANCRAVGQLN